MSEDKKEARRYGDRTRRRNEALHPSIAEIVCKGRAELRNFENAARVIAGFYNLGEIKRAVTFRAGMGSLTPSAGFTAIRLAVAWPDAPTLTTRGRAVQ